MHLHDSNQCVILASVNQGIMHSGSDILALLHVQRAPLHIAAKKGYDQAVLYLADNGADVNKV